MVIFNIFDCGILINLFHYFMWCFQRLGPLNWSHYVVLGANVDPLEEQTALEH